MSYSYSMSSSSSSGGGGAVLGMSSGGAAVSGGGLSVGGGGVGLQGGSTVLSGGSVGVGGGGLSVGSGAGLGVGGGVGGGSVSFARKTNVARSAGGAGASGNSMMMALSALGGGTATYAGSHELGANPKAVIQRRDREKHDINDLNIKLAEYIEQNGYYRIKVKEQEKLIIKIKGEFESIEARLRQIYDAELANLRGVIDATAKEKAAVELKVQTLEALYKDFRAKYEAELSAHESTRLRLPKLEKELSEKDAQIDYLAKTLTALEPQVSALKAQISTYQKESIEAKMGADAEIVTRVELESKLVTKQDEIDFLKRVYEEKLRMALDFDIDSDATYSNDLAEALKDIRAEYQAQLESIRGDTDESWFQSKFNTMMQTSQKQGQELAIAREETARMKARFNESVTSVNTFKAKIASLEASMAEMTADFENEKRLHAVALADRDAQIVEYKRQIAAHILELKGLMDAKLSLDEEIATYRRLLLAGGSTTVVGGGGLHGGVEVVTETTKVVSGGGVSVSGGGGGITVSGGGGGLTVSGGGAGIAVGGGGGGAGIAVGGGGGGGAASMSMSTSSSTVTSTGFGSRITDTERGYYSGVFTAYDRSGDGRIDGGELLAMFNEFDNRPFGGRAKRNATAQYCTSLMSTADSDGSGKLNFEEFLRLMVFEKKIFLKNAFKAADAGGKGYLTQQEVLNGLAAAGYEVDANAQALVLGARGGADGKISYNEFVMNL